MRNFGVDNQEKYPNYIGDAYYEGFASGFWAGMLFTFIGTVTLIAVALWLLGAF